MSIHVSNDAAYLTQTKGPAHWSDNVLCRDNAETGVGISNVGTHYRRLQ